MISKPKLIGGGVGGGGRVEGLNCFKGLLERDQKTTIEKKD